MHCDDIAKHGVICGARIDNDHRQAWPAVRTFLNTETMASATRPPARITARLIAWEGGSGERVNEQKLIKEYTSHLKESITEAAEGTGWRYQRFKTYKTSREGTFKLEVDPFVFPGLTALEFVLISLLPATSCSLGCTRLEHGQRATASALRQTPQLTACHPPSVTQSRGRLHLCSFARGHTNTYRQEVHALLQRWHSWAILREHKAVKRYGGREGRLFDEELYQVHPYNVSPGTASGLLDARTKLSLECWVCTTPQQWLHAAKARSRSLPSSWRSSTLLRLTGVLSGSASLFPGPLTSEQPAWRQPPSVSGFPLRRLATS